MDYSSLPVSDRCRRRPWCQPALPCGFLGSPGGLGNVGGVTALPDSSCLRMCWASLSLGVNLAAWAKCCLGLVFRAGHQIVIPQQELPGGRVGHVGHGLFQLAKLLGVPVGIVVIGIQWAQSLGAPKAKAAWASVAAPRYSPEANKASDINSWTFAFCGDSTPAVAGQPQCIAIIAPGECSPGFVVILKALVRRCLAVVGRRLGHRSAATAGPGA